MFTYSGAMMDLRESLEFIRSHEKELRLFNLARSDAIHEELRTFFEAHNVRITRARTASGKPEGVAILSNTIEVLAIVDVATLRELLATVPTGPGEFGIADGEYESVLSPLKETSFTSYDTKQLLYASREIEDRARRTGQGSIHVGFQLCSTMAEECSIYADLAGRGVSVHAYGVPDATPPNLGSGQVHAVQTDEIAEMWFVIFDGSGDERQKTALLAQERDEGTFYGGWTYDPGFVDHILAYLNQTYGSSTDDLTSDL